MYVFKKANHGNKLSIEYETNELYIKFITLLQREKTVQEAFQTSILCA